MKPLCCSSRLNMEIAEDQVEDHYTAGDLLERIRSALEAAGKDWSALAVDDLSALDAFHIRGRAATEELAGWAAPQSSDLVLDVGCGLGGTARYLASRFGCKICGVDLTDEFCSAAAVLNEKVGLGSSIDIRCASALALPFGDKQFDLAWTEHAQMNIAEKGRFYGEIERVLKDGGKLAFHDVFLGDGQPLEFPLPWASKAELSSLIGVEECRDLLSGLGMKFLRWEETTEESIQFFRAALDKHGPSGLFRQGLHRISGTDAAKRFTNLLDNLEQGKLRVVQAVLQK